MQEKMKNLITSLTMNKMMMAKLDIIFRKKKKQRKIHPDKITLFTVSDTRIYFQANLPPSCPPTPPSVYEFFISTTTIIQHPL